MFDKSKSFSQRQHLAEVFLSGIEVVVSLSAKYNFFRFTTVPKELIDWGGIQAIILPYKCSYMQLHKEMKIYF